MDAHNFTCCNLPYCGTGCPLTSKLSMGKMFVSPMNRRSPSTETVGVAIGAVSTVDGADDSLAGCDCTDTPREAGLNDDGGGCAEDEVEGVIFNKTFSVDGTVSSCA